VSLWIRRHADLAARVGTRRLVDEAHCDFVKASGDASPPREVMTQLSRELATDVLWLSVQPAVDAFEYVHYKAGSVLRVLVYGCTEERVWEAIEGAPQPWETWRRPPKLGSMNFSFHGEAAAAIARHYRLSGLGVPVEKQPAPKKKPPAKPYKIEKRRKT
jgi:hypothetical protein